MIRMLFFYFTLWDERKKKNDRHFDNNKKKKKLKHKHTHTHIWLINLLSIYRLI